VKNLAGGHPFCDAVEKERNYPPKTWSSVMQKKRWRSRVFLGGGFCTSGNQRFPRGAGTFFLESAGSTYRYP